MTTLSAKRPQETDEGFRARAQELITEAEHQCDDLLKALKGICTELSVYAKDHASISQKIWLEGMVKRYAIAAAEGERRAE